MKTLIRWISLLWPIGILGIFELLLIATNYTPGTYLMGWDNIMPEFNFGAALKTNLFGAWQEYRGLGLADGMGHAANLVHTLSIWLLSLVLPQNTLRYGFHFLMHFAGMAGMYVLIHTLTQKRTVSITGALFYGFNPATIQMFYAPLEAFSVHYASLPWLAYSLTRYLEKPYRNTLLLFITVSILTTPQFFVPTYILPVAITLGAIAIPYIRKTKHIIVAGLTFIAVNAFWLLPYVYNLPQNAPVIQNAKINQMSSDEVYARNRAFGDLENVLTLKGLMLDFEDVDTQGLPVYVMDTWRTFLSLPGIRTASLSLAFLGLLGAMLTLVNRNTLHDRRVRSYAILFGLSVILLANNTPGLTTVMEVLRSHIPLFAEAYRFPFTKFVLMYAMAASVLIAWAVHRISPRHIQTIITLTVLTAIIGLSAPAFQGSFFYNALRIPLPKDYTDIFAFMAKKNPTGRTAYLPIPNYWSWKQYKHGYIGSGFIWFGLSQPLMDRAFDPWSSANENYYWELSRALYSKNTEAVSSVLNKYDIHYVILDTNLWSQGHDRALFTEDITSLFTGMPDMRLVTQKGSVYIYERETPGTQFIKTTGILPGISTPYLWTDNDVAYSTLGDYMVDESNKDTINIPFRSLFTKRAVNEREYTIDESENIITIKSNILQDSIINAEIDKTAPLFGTEKNKVLATQAIKPCGVLKSGTVQTTVIDNNLRMTSRDQRGCTSFGLGSLPHEDAYLIAIESRNITGRPIMFSIINDTAKHVEIETLLTPRKQGEWQTDYFVLPPLAADGVGYTTYITNDAIGSAETINDIRHITVYPLPYEMLASYVTQVNLPDRGQAPLIAAIHHPNPAYYRVTTKSNTNGMLILSQAYNPHWKAFDITGKASIAAYFPWIFGSEIKTHRLVNNWENGWEVTGSQKDIVILFMPQLLQYAGFSLLFVTLLFVVLRKQKTS